MVTAGAGVLGPTMDRSREPLEGMLLTGHRTKSGCPDTLSQSGAYLAYLHQDVTGMLLVTQLLGVGASAELRGIGLSQCLALWLTP